MGADPNDPDFSESLAEIVEAQGWTPGTVQDLALEFIRDQHLEDEFLAHLHAQAEYENADVPEWTL